MAKATKAKVKAKAKKAAKRTAVRAKPKARPKGRSRIGSGRTIERDLLLAATPAEVWRLWTTPEGLTSWFASSAELDLRPGGRMTLRFPNDGCPALDAKVVAVEPGRRFVMDWHPDDMKTRVEVALMPEGSGTRMRVIQSGFGDGPKWDRWYLDHAAGWATELAKIFVALEGVRRGNSWIEIYDTVKAPPAEVWKAIGSADGLARWFAGPGGALEPRPGGRYRLPAGPATIEGEVREYVPERALSLSWTTQPCEAKALPAPTLLTITLAPDRRGGGTLVTLAHSGFGDAPAWAGVRDEHEGTWRFLFANLASVVTRGVDRRGARKVERALALAAPPEKAWALMTTRAGLRSWLMPKATVDLRPGGAIELGTFGKSGTWRIAELDEAARRIVLTLPASVEPHDDVFGATEVTMAVEPREGGAGGCRVRFVESGFGSGPKWDEWYHGAESGWDEIAGLFHLLLEGHAGERGRRRSIVKEVVVAAPRDRVWQAVATGDGLASWWLGGASIEAREGGRYRMTGAGVTVEGEVREAVPGRSLAFAWTRFPCEGGVDLPAPTLISFVLLDEPGGGTRVRLVHSGFGGAGDAAWDEIHDSHVQGWDFFVPNLKSVLETGRDLRREPAGSAS